MNASHNLIHTRENLLTYSEQFDHADWTKTNASISGNAVVAPDGTLTADKLVEDSSASPYHRTNQLIVGADTTTYLPSVYAKAGERTELSFLFWDLANEQLIENITFDLVNGTIVSGSGLYTMELIVDGWYRISVTGTTTTGIGNIGVYSQLSVGGSVNYTGDGSSGLYLWGAQVTESSSLLPYSKTEASALAGPYAGVDVNPDFKKFKWGGKKIENRHRVRDGGEFIYKWGDYRTVLAPVKFVNSSFAADVNSWWSSNADLLFVENYTTKVESVHLINKTKPIDQFVKPHDDLFMGKIELGTY